MPATARAVAPTAADAPPPSNVVWIPLPEGMALPVCRVPSTRTDDGDDDGASDGDDTLWGHLSGAWLRLCRHRKAA
ncbi:hypothetical protein J2847_003430 [Azospirillum agricola]|uniref:hypothetical protein n=1 Tax=Azospirillum agricola TaxID=1720247 RepID=UPI001AE2764F|nr:hypothetical protein [Azospirillum agricola]MBP2230127.1 hypothetical protein [Azospirillum agricola]